MMTEQREEYIINEISARLERQSKEVVARNALFDALREWRKSIAFTHTAERCYRATSKLAAAYDAWAATQ